MLGSFFWLDNIGLSGLYEIGTDMHPNARARKPFMQRNRIILLAS